MKEVREQPNMVAMTRVMPTITTTVCAILVLVILKPADLLSPWKPRPRSLTSEGGRVNTPRLWKESVSQEPQRSPRWADANLPPANYLCRKSMPVCCPFMAEVPPSL